MALPWLEAMALGSTAEAPCRMAVIYVPIGKNLGAWIPKQAGADYETPQTLKEIEELRKDFTILSGLCHPRVWGGHRVEGASFLTGVDIISGTPGADFKNYVSMDQIAAERLGSKTRFSSLELIKKVDTVILTEAAAEFCIKNCTPSHELLELHFALNQPSVEKVTRTLLFEP